MPPSHRDRCRRNTLSIRTSPGRTLSAVLLALALTLSWLAVAPPGAQASVVLTRTLTPLDAGNPWIAHVGTNRGSGMEREPLDIAASAGAVVEARVTNGIGDVVLSLMTDNHNTDVQSAALPTNGNWVTVTAAADSAIFVRQKRWATAPQIEYRVTSGTSHSLPVYRHGDDQAAFTSAWTAGASPFAVIHDATFTMLVPRVDLPKLTDMGWSDFDTIDEVVAFYRHLIGTYNEWLGIDDADPSPVHHDLQQAYYIRPDADGWGLAYYMGGNYVGTNNNSVSYYLDSPNAWLILHEVGHGYDGIMTSAATPDDMALGEVWNNIYSYLYQTDVNGNVESNWLNNNGKANGQNGRDALRRQQGGLDWDTIGLRERLDAMARIAELTGPEGFAGFNRALRELRAESTFTQWPARKDLVAEHWGAPAGFDLVPWLEDHGLTLDEATAQRVVDIQRLPIAMPLSDFFPAPARATSIAAQLGLEAPGDLVTTAQIAATGANGSVSVTATAPVPANIEGRAVTLWHGEDEVARAAFTGGSASFTGVPVGAYTIRYPEDRVTGAVPQRSWVTVAEGTSTATAVTYPVGTPPAGVNGSRLTLQGLGNGTFAAVTHDPARATLEITDTLGAPHSYFSDQYARIQVSDGATSLYDRSFIGTGSRNLPRTVTVPATIGTTITITHREHGSRVVETDLRTGEAKPSLNATAQVSTYVVTEHGLAKSGNSALADYTAALTGELSDLQALAGQHPSARLEVAAADLLAGISALPVGAERTALTATYGALLDALVAPARAEDETGPARVPVTLVTALAAQPGAEASHMFDGDPGTWFHSPWSGTESFPYNIDLDLGTDPVTAEGLVMTPHVGSGTGAANGRPGQYLILAGDDLASLTEVASGTWTNDSQPKLVGFESRARYVRLQILTTYGSPAQRFVAINELAVLGSPAHLGVTMARTDTVGASASVGDVLRFSVTYTNNTGHTLTAFPRSSNLASTLTSGTPNCRYGNLGAGATHTCTSAHHTVTAADAAAGSFSPRIVFDATGDTAGTDVIQAGFVASLPEIPISS